MTDLFVPVYPSVVYDLPAEIYHRTWPCLSTSGEKKILSSCPSIFKWEVDHPDEASKTKSLTFGDLAHAILLGQVHRYGPLPTGHNGTTKEGKEATASVIADGKTPVKRDVWDAAHEMTRVVLAHLILGKVYASGKAEVSMFWRDQEFGVNCRARADWLPDYMPIVLDYKTAESCSRDALQKALLNYGYALQAVHYEEACQETMDAENSFLLAFQEKTPPYPVVIAQPDEAAMAYARKKIRRARAIFADCLETGIWPGYADSDVVQLGLPSWALKREEFDDE